VRVQIAGLRLEFGRPQPGKEAAADVVEREALRRRDAVTVKSHMSPGWLGRDPADLAQQVDMGRLKQRGS
jgi:hypothetical protein